MEFFSFLIEKLNIDLIIVSIVFLSGFFQEKYLYRFIISKDGKYDSTVKTLAVSFFASAVYVFLVYNKTEPLPLAKYFISYFTATSLYDLVINPLTKMIRKASAKLGGDKEE